jgi:penicillin-binding protein 1A
MPHNQYSDGELERYFSDPQARRGRVPDDEARRRAQLVLRRMAIGVGAAILAIVLFLGALTFTLPSTELIENPEHLESTVVYTADGVEMARYYLGQNRTWVSGRQIAPVMQEALVAVEDRRFFHHWGVDIRGMVSVAWGAVTGQGVRGGSTLSMQLARNLYEQIGFERSPIRKLREILTAVQIERRYTKAEIIEMYLNTVPWGHNAFGIESAAQTYFNKPAIDLQVEEAAVLVGMLQGTTMFNPVRHPERSRARRNVVLAAMVRADYLPAERYAELSAEPIHLDFHPYSHTDNLAPHLAEILRDELRAWGREQGYNIYTDGLVVHTSIDSRVQELARAAVEAQGSKLQAVVDVEWSQRSMFRAASEDAYVERIRNGNVEPWAYFWQSQTRLVDSFIRDTDRFRSMRRAGTDPGEVLTALRADELFMDSLKTAKTRLETGLVALNPNNGFAVAWVGGRDFVADKFDHVRLARRQSGSTFKPFVFAAAIDNGYSPYYRLMDSTFVWQQQGAPTWIPRNAGGISGQYMTLRRVLAQSVNIPTARLTYEVGPMTVKRYAERLGIESPIEAVPSIGLGVADVTLLEMVAAYATLANGGTYYQPRVITRIEDRKGNVLAEFTPRGREAISANTAYTVVDMLREAVNDGTGGRIRWKFGVRNHDVAGKTGTTQEGADGWFVLMHPDLVVGSWVGFNDRRVQFRSSTWGTGSRTGLHVVGDFLQRITRTDNPAIRLNEGRRFEPPSGYVVPLPPHEEHRPALRILEQMQERDRRIERERQQTPPRRDAERRGRVGW